MKKSVIFAAVAVLFFSTFLFAQDVKSSGAGNVEKKSTDVVKKKIVKKEEPKKNIGKKEEKKLPDTVKVGILAKDGKDKCIKQWGPFGKYLSEKLGVNVEIVPMAFDGFYSAIENKEVDFFLVNSSMFAVANIKYGAEAIATMLNSRQGEELDRFGGVIFTTSDNDDINSLADLKGKTFMAVSKNSFGGWQMAYKVFLDNGIDPFKDFETLSFAKTHDKVVTSVYEGAVDAGTVRTDTIERLVEEGFLDIDDVKVLNNKEYGEFPFVCSTELYPEWPFAKVNGTDDYLAEKMVEALKSMPKDSGAASSAKIVGWVDPLDYSGVVELQKKLKIGAFKK